MSCDGSAYCYGWETRQVRGYQLIDRTASPCGPGGQISFKLANQIVACRRRRFQPLDQAGPLFEDCLQPADLGFALRLGVAKLAAETLQGFNSALEAGDRLVLPYDILVRSGDREIPRADSPSQLHDLRSGRRARFQAASRLVRAAASAHASSSCCPRAAICV